MNNKRKKVLIIAYAYEPNKTSEPGVGWFFTHEISKFMDVTVVTRENNRNLIEEAEIFHDNIKYIYFDLAISLRKIKKRIPFGIQLYYSLWQRKVYKYLKNKHDVDSGKFDVIHHLTFGTTKNVPPIYKFKTPFIWGPIGGGDIIPFRFLMKMRLGTIFSEIIYRTTNYISRCSINFYFSIRASKAIIFRTSSTKQNFPNQGCINRYLISETAIMSLTTRKRKIKTNEKINAICVGRLLESKGFLLALQGFNCFIQAGGEGTLTFYGEGKDEGKLKKYVRDNNIEEYVMFKGFVPNSEVKKAMDMSQVLLHPSFREGGSWSILEAMVSGCPVICLDASGPKDMVTNSCGFMINMHSPKQVSKDIGNALIMLAKDSKLYEKYSDNAILRIIENYTWDKRNVEIRQVYNDVLK